MLRLPAPRAQAPAQRPCSRRRGRHAPAVAVGYVAPGADGALHPAPLGRCSGKGVAGEGIGGGGVLASGARVRAHARCTCGDGWRMQPQPGLAHQISSVQRSASPRTQGCCRGLAPRGCPACTGRHGQLAAGERLQGERQRSTSGTCSVSGAPAGGSTRRSSPGAQLTAGGLGGCRFGRQMRSTGGTQRPAGHSTPPNTRRFPSQTRRRGWRRGRAACACRAGRQRAGLAAGGLLRAGARGTYAVPQRAWRARLTGWACAPCACAPCECARAVRVLVARIAQRALQAAALGGCGRASGVRGHEGQGQGAAAMQAGRRGLHTPDAKACTPEYQ